VLNFKGTVVNKKGGAMYLWLFLNSYILLKAARINKLWQFLLDRAET